MEASIAVAGVLIAAAILGFELRLPSAILEIIGGVLIAALLPGVAELDWLQFLATLGLLGLMFSAGYEVDTVQLRRDWRSATGIGIASFAVPALALFAVVHLGFGLAPRAAGVVAAGLSTTSLALVYYALAERDLLREPLGQSLLAAASVVDVLSMIVLALLLGDVGWGTALFVLVVGPTLLGLPHFLAPVLRRYRRSLAEFELRLLMVVVVGMAFMAENVGGIHSAIVAFAVGVAMSELGEHQAWLRHKLTAIVFSLFAPMFFIEAGARLDPAALSTDVLGTAAALFAVAVALKFAGTALPARWLLGSSAGFAGILFNYRLSFGIVAASAGLNSGLLGEDLYAVMLMVVVGSALLPALALRRSAHASTPEPL